MKRVSGASMGLVWPEAEGIGQAWSTLNIWRMFVTPEVFQLEMSASKFSKLKKSQLMSETAETSQSTMGPYVASAEATSASYA